MRFFAIFVCLVFASVSSGEPEAEVEALLSRMHEATKAADADTYFNLFTDDAVFFGTDIWERWPLDEFEALYRPYMESGRGWWFQMRDRHVTIQPGGSVALFDETLYSDAYGQCRGTGACRLEDGTWKIASYHLDITMPNGIADELVSLIRQYEASHIELMTFNIRYGTANDGLNAWPNRRGLVAELIRAEAPDVLGLQEALRLQIDELAEELPGYAWVGAGRDDGAEAGEFTPIFYITDKLRLINHHTFWLSDTPDVPGSATYGNTIPRICTWASFEPIHTDDPQRFIVANVHLDHQSPESRLKAIRQIRRTITAEANNAPIFIIGDFNCLPDSEPVRELTDNGWKPSLEGDVGTFHSFTGNAGSRRIDLILVPNEHTVEQAEVITVGGERGIWPSDHFPVHATVTLNPNIAE